MKRGKVYLIGAGPGDPGLITIKGLDCLKQAEVVIYDRLIDDSLLGATPPDTEKIYVGKSADCHSLVQEEINKLLVAKAKEGKVVVRLKGGDPFVLGRGGEEAEALVANHIPFEIIPGITSSLAVPAYAGIPVTHREVASSFVVITGHEAAEKEKSVIAWDKLSTGADTLVLLMGVGNLAYIVDHLMANGRPPDTPVAVIANGTTPRQCTLVGTLQDIVIKAEQNKLQPPAVIVVGEVVRLREKLRWFDNLPLFGKRILVTRPRHQASRLSQLLLKRGASPVEIPAIDIQPPPTNNDLDRVILNLKDYHWIIFTSTNGVDAFFQRLQAHNLDARGLANIQLGVIGAATANALAQRGLQVDLMPERYTSRGLLKELQCQDMTGRRVLLPRADIAGKELTDGLTQLGAEVEEIAAYQTTPNTGGIPQAKEKVLTGEIDIITFSSASTVVNLVTALSNELEALNNTVIACIGPETEAAAVRSGLRVDIVAEEHTIPGLVEAMEQYYRRRENG